METIKDIVLKGELVAHHVQETYEQGNYDSDWNCESWDDQTEDITVLGLKQENREIIVLAEELNNLLTRLEYDCKRSEGISASITYHVTNVALNEDELILSMMKTMEGEPESKYGHHFSDLTGYLWTDEKFIINNHNVIDEIYSQVSGEYGKYSLEDKLKEQKKFLYFKVEFSKINV